MSKWITRAWAMLILSVLLYRSGLSITSAEWWLWFGVFSFTFGLLEGLSRR